VKLGYTLRAARQIEQAPAYVARQSPRGAASVQGRVLAITAVLQQFPETGHATTRAGVRRIAVSPHPYLIDYRIVADEIVVLRFRHAARKPA